MANALYTKGKENLLSGVIDMTNDDIKAVFVDGADYSPTLATDDELADIPVGARVATSGALQSKTFTDGVFDAADITVSAVSGDQFEYIVLYDDTSSGDKLIAIIDSATGIPCTPNGGDITIQWDSGASKIFKLS
jgi:hypothetical protein